MQGPSLAAALPVSSPAPSVVAIQYQIGGDLRSVDGEVVRLECFEQPRPDPFVTAFAVLLVFELRLTPSCGPFAQVEWKIMTQPRSGRDAPEALRVQVNYREKN
jgi:hypothetical protein